MPAVSAAQACVHNWSEFNAVRASQSDIRICGNVVFPSGTRITNRIIFEGSDASWSVLDCRNGQIDFPAGTATNTDLLVVRSNEVGGVWSAPIGVSVKSCKINGAVRVQGVAPNVNRDFLIEESKKAGYVDWLRSKAPVGTTFDTVDITGLGRIPFYVATGASFTRFVNGRFLGRSDASTIYLGAETTATVIRDSEMHTTPDGKPVISIDASDYNRIINNHISGASAGGIHLYRNCGEGPHSGPFKDIGVSRHTTPSNNQIINNYFYYNNDLPSPSIFLGSRNGSPGYCDFDDGYPFGSGVSDYDYAAYNVVAMNQIRKHAVADTFRIGRGGSDEPNFVFKNETVWDRNFRKAGCYEAGLFGAPWREHGQTAEYIFGGTASSVCIVARCADGEFQWESFCPTQPVLSSFVCEVTGNNNGCGGTISCPAGTKIASAVAGCNLEWGQVSASDVETLPTGTVNVFVPSGIVEQGFCRLGAVAIQEGRKPPLAIVPEQWYAVGRFGGVKVPVNHASPPNAPTASTNLSCSEHDNNGGDCYARATLFCK